MENNNDPAYGYQHHQQPIPASPKHIRQTGSRSAEYIFSAIALLTAASSLAAILIIWVNGGLTKGGVGFGLMAFPAAALIVALPVFVGLLMDLARAELKNPHLKLSPYKKYSALFVQVVAFTTCFFTLIGLVFGIFLSAAAPSDGSLARLFTDCLIILAVAGGILVYPIMNARYKS